MELFDENDSRKRRTKTRLWIEHDEHIAQSLRQFDEWYKEAVKQFADAEKSIEEVVEGITPEIQPEDCSWT